MDIERTAAVIRLRTAAEAVDFGFALVRQWWQPIYGGLAFTMLPVLFFIVAFSSKDVFWSLFFIWLLKPVFERLPLVVISRAFFGQTLGTFDAIRATGVPALGRWPALFLVRFSPLRAYISPVDELERPDSVLRRKRVMVLMRRQSANAVGLAIGAWCAEWLLYLSLFSILFLLLPQSILENPDADISILAFLKGEAPLWMYVYSGFAYTLSIFLVMPFYVGGGFALYINRRVHLEGWDIDLEFRRLSKRLQRMSAALLFLCCAIGPASFSYAATQENSLHHRPKEMLQNSEVDRVKAIAKEVLASPDFGDTFFDVRWVKIPEPSEKNEAEATNETRKSLGVGKVMMGVLVGTGVVLLVLLVITLMRGMRHSHGTSSKSSSSPPTRLFGLDLREASLPDDLLAAARSAWKKGEHKEALSILYRGALVHVVRELGVMVPRSATEGECVQLVYTRLKTRDTTSSRPGSLFATDFQALTGIWQLTAYGCQPPSDIAFSDLLQRWQPHLAKRQQP